MKRKNEGEVVAVGPGALTKEGQRIPMQVQVGDKVMLPEYGGHTLKFEDIPEGEEYILYRDEDILARFE